LRANPTTRGVWDFYFRMRAEGDLNHPLESWQKRLAGGAITHELTSPTTRQSAQFSLGMANLTHGGNLASDFGKIISIFRVGFVSFFKHPYIRFGSPEPSTMPKKHRKLEFAWLLLCVGSLIFPARAGATDQSGLPFIVDVWTSKEGLPGNVVVSVIQTRMGISGSERSTAWCVLTETVSPFSMNTIRPV